MNICLALQGGKSAWRSHLPRPMGTGPLQVFGRSLQQTAVVYQVQAAAGHVAPGSTRNTRQSKRMEYLGACGYSSTAVWCHHSGKQNPDTKHSLLEVMGLRTFILLLNKLLSSNHCQPTGADTPLRQQIKHELQPKRHHPALSHTAAQRAGPQLCEEHCLCGRTCLSNNPTDHQILST